MKETYFYLDVGFFALEGGNQTSKRLVFNCF